MQPFGLDWNWEQHDDLADGRSLGSRCVSIYRAGSHSELTRCCCRAKNRLAFSSWISRNDRFDEFPVIFAGQFTICEGSGDAVVAEVTVEDVREAGGGSLTEVGDQVIAVNIDHLSVHAGSLGVHVDAVKSSRILWSSVGGLKLAA